MSFYSSDWLFKINWKKNNIIMVVVNFYYYFFYMINNYLDCIFFLYDKCVCVCVSIQCLLSCSVHRMTVKTLSLFISEYSLRRLFFLHIDLFLSGSIDLRNLLLDYNLIEKKYIYIYK
jgi:hypothetical protein